MFLAIYDDNSFTCTESGEMPDPYDETVFYICRKMRGSPGYYTTRMICPPNTSFDPLRRICSSTQKRKNEIRREKIRKRRQSINLEDIQSKTSAFDTFSCASEGRFPDKLDRNSYYLCFKNAGKFNAMHMKCPNEHYFSGYDNSCVKMSEVSTNYIVK
ncbi:uncharacterized protein LOC113372827 [Ctenocephalides felis]|uniref:uncharacterized protein LOC113372827 n=1 Tax=Ctenocephalides felis TaxID=7515 RepID=UPI000E6E5980|nr:uncharacterized protein LOC113372827 [Ctenocephalides felis]